MDIFLYFVLLFYIFAAVLLGQMMLRRRTFSKKMKGKLVFTKSADNQ